MLSHDLHLNGTSSVSSITRGMSYTFLSFSSWQKCSVRGLCILVRICALQLCV